MDVWILKFGSPLLCFPRVSFTFGVLRVLDSATRNSWGLWPPGLAWLPVCLVSLCLPGQFQAQVRRTTGISVHMCAWIAVRGVETFSITVVSNNAERKRKKRDRFFSRNSFGQGPEKNALWLLQKTWLCSSTNFIFKHSLLSLFFSFFIQ